MSSELHAPDAAPAPRTSSSVRRSLVAMIALWLCAIGGGFGVLTHHSMLPGAAARAPEQWPAGSTLELARDRPTLVMIAHPQCTCTRASIAELSRLTARLGERMTTYVLFLKPQNVADGWERTSLWQAVSTLDDVKAIADDGGREAERFGALTSGQTYLFDPQGQLLFRGGITPSRGHQGDNVGSQRIAALVHGETPLRSLSEVFGCALSESSDDDFWFSWLRPAGPPVSR